METWSKTCGLLSNRLILSHTHTILVMPVAHGSLLAQAPHAVKLTKPEGLHELSSVFSFNELDELLRYS